MSSQISDECVGEEREIEVEVDRARTRRGCFWKRWTETRKYREVSLRFERAKGFIARPRIRFGVWAGELSTSELVACELPEAGRTSSRGGLHASYILLQPFFFLHHVSTAPPLGLDRFFEFLFLYFFLRSLIRGDALAPRLYTTSGFFIHSFHVSAMWVMKRPGTRSRAEQEHTVDRFYQYLNH